MREHQVDQFVIAPFGVGEAELRIGRTFFPQQRACGNAYRLDQFDEPGPAWRILQVFNHLGFLAALPDYRQRIARGAAGRVVIDRHAHDRASFAIASTSPAPRSSQPITIMAASAPQSSAAMNPGRSVGRIPENVLVSDRAMATAGLANDVEDVNQ